MWEDGFDVRNSAINTVCIEFEYEFSFTESMVRPPVLEMINSSNDEINQIPVATETTK
jgi:hypothetical protein